MLSFDSGRRERLTARLDLPDESQACSKTEEVIRVGMGNDADSAVRSVGGGGSCSE